MPPTSWWRRSSAATARAGAAWTISLENGVYSFQYHPELARDPSVNDGKGTQDYVRYCINLAERRISGSRRQRDLYQRMADYEELIFQVRDGGREVTVANPTDGASPRWWSSSGCRSPACGTATRSWSTSAGRLRDGAAARPGGQVTLRFEPETRGPLLRQPSNKGLVILDARHDPRTGETRIVVSVCREQPLGVEGVDPEGVYGVQVDDEPAADVGRDRAHHPGAAEQEDRRCRGSRTRRTKTPGMTRSSSCDRRRREQVRRAHHPHPPLPAEKARRVRKAHRRHP